MPAWLLLRLVPREVYLGLLVLLLVQLAGIDAFGMILDTVVTPIWSWIEQEVIDQFTFW